MTEIVVDKAILEDNDRLAAEIRRVFQEKNVYCLNVMGSPGAGKTTLLEALITRLTGKYRMGVIEGDMATTRDRDRIAALGIQAVQIITQKYGSSCHMNALMVKNALKQFDLDNLDVLIIENVGNLVCPAEFDIGEHARLVVLSITEGEDKPLKYPVMFARTQAVAINKVDLAEILGTDLKQIYDNILMCNTDAITFEVSATKGTGLEEMIVWLETQMRHRD
ncbi:MAG TPA: hydrogenase nickel incorporation protein HypB [bacterium]|nr:hydrogenase nickel incorporation protein HypB [bacterium]